MRARQETITTDFQQSSIAVSDLTNQLAVVSDALEDIKVRAVTHCCYRIGISTGSFTCGLCALLNLFHRMLPCADANRFAWQFYDRHVAAVED